VAERRDSGELAGAERDLSLSLTVIARIMRNRFDLNIAPHGVTRSQWTLIAVVARRPGASQRLIADALEVTEAAAGRLIERLCSDGLLERRQDSGDKRAWRVYLTSAAEPLLTVLADAGRAIEAVAFANFSPDEVDQLAVLLGKVHANLTEPRTDPAA
jgi:DNA-binding MarR family transcriptional regulator